ncbi:chemotaxis protein CheB [Telluribacter sp. SYSU D00476]|uniref:chemotaxis protein CheB n=1 Tax=Telluribacter sp. SYSU D00476 TaxID=2811430 RepID=UPI001FF5FED4|nr:chemotaxis protein CheB [Telluribacter sp. SYSU D00476]
MAQNAITPYQYVVLGGSAGSLEVILNLVERLPEHLNAVIIIVIHRKNDKDSILQELIANRTRLSVREVEDKDPIQFNTIYLAPPDYHLLIENKELFSLDSSEKIHYSRPSIDVTFESVAEVFGKSVIGVLLSGANADGAAGLAQIKRSGGYTIAQNPATAEVAYMPQQAINLTEVNDIVNADELADVLKQLLIPHIS